MPSSEPENESMEPENLKKLRAQCMLLNRQAPRKKATVETHREASLPRPL